MQILKFIKSITFIVLLTAFTASKAQVTFEAKVSKTTLGLNERLRVDFEMNEDGDNFVPPSFTDFNVVGGPNTSVRNFWANGKRSFSKTYSYFLAPKEKGNFKINSAAIDIGGQTYKTKPVSIKVTNAIEKPKNPNDPSYIASQNIHLVAEVSKTNPYLNEAIMVIYKLYIAPEVAANFLGDKDVPQYEDFWNQNIEVKALRPENGKYQGKDYRYVVLKKVVLYPQKTGKLKLDPYSINLAVKVPTNRYDIFGSRIMPSVNQTFSSAARTINVKPLPEEGKPADFNGAVGDFKFDVATNKLSLDAGETLEAWVEVSGKGNLKLFELPKLTVPSSLEVYEPEHRENVRTNLGGMQGSSSDVYTIIPQYKGKYPIPSVSFSYFDPKARQYKRLTSDEIVIDVINGPSSVAATNNTNNTNVNKQAVTTGNNPFAFIKTKPNWISKEGKSFFKSTLFWLLLLLPLLLIPIVIILKRQQEKRDADIVGNRRRKADRLAKKYLSSAKKALGNKEAFYIALERAFHNYLKVKLQIETSEFNKEKIENLLTERSVTQDTVSAFISILESCELARYTPITQVTMENDYQKSVKAIGEIDKQMR